MDTYALHHHYPDTRPELFGWLAAGFVFGAIAVLIFHQGALGLLNAFGVTSVTPHSVQRTEPFGIPQLWSQAFWGGVWGVVLAFVLQRLEGVRLVVAAAIFGMIVPTLVAWFVVAAIKGQPLAAGFAPKAMATGLAVNFAWGLGTGWGLAAISGRRRYYEGG